MFFFQFFYDMVQKVVNFMHINWKLFVFCVIDYGLNLMRSQGLFRKKGFLKNKVKFRKDLVFLRNIGLFS